MTTVEKDEITEMIDNMSEEECSKIILNGLKQNNPELRITEVYENDTLIYAQVYDPENKTTCFEIKVRNYENLEVKR